MALRRNAGNQAFYRNDGLELAYKQSQPALSAPRAGQAHGCPTKWVPCDDERQQKKRSSSAFARS
jgi:hypothetical protein